MWKPLVAIPFPKMNQTDFPTTVIAKLAHFRWLWIYGFMQRSSFCSLLFAWFKKKTGKRTVLNAVVSFGHALITHYSFRLLYSLRFHQASRMNLFSNRKWQNNKNAFGAVRLSRCLHRIAAFSWQTTIS